jgi:hypothetical protein
MTGRPSCGLRIAQTTSFSGVGANSSLYCEIVSRSRRLYGTGIDPLKDFSDAAREELRVYRVLEAG